VFVRHDTPHPKDLRERRGRFLSSQQKTSTSSDTPHQHEEVLSCFRIRYLVCRSQQLSEFYFYQLPHIEYNLHKNSFINRCLFNYRRLLFFTSYTIHICLVAFITMLCCSCSSNMNSFIGLVFVLSSVYMSYGLSHCIAQYFVFRVYDSALATIILKATWLDLTWLDT